MTDNTKQFPLPECGIYFGSGVYPMSYGYLTNAMHAHQKWTPQSFSPMEIINKVIEDNQGNMVQLWGHSRGYAPSTLAQWYYALDEIGIEVPEPDWDKGAYIFPSDSPELSKYDDRYGVGLWKFVRKAA